MMRGRAMSRGRVMKPCSSASFNRCRRERVERVDSLDSCSMYGGVMDCTLQPQKIPEMKAARARKRAKTQPRSA